MEVKQLQYLLSIMEHGSYRKAAKALHVSEPALSKAISRLEISAGARLLDRNRTGVTPTVFGRAILTHARNVLSELDQARNTLAQLAGTSRSVVRVGSDASFTTVVLPRTVGRFHREQPEVRVVIERASRPELLHMLSTGALDMVTLELSSFELDPSLQAETLMVDETRLVVRSDHPLARLPDLKVADLASFGWILPASGHFMRMQADELFSAAHFQPASVVIETDNVQAAKQCLLEGDFITFLPHQYTYIEEQLGLLKKIDIPGMGWSHVLGFIRRVHAIASPASRAFISQMRIVCAELKREEINGSGHHG